MKQRTLITEALLASLNVWSKPRFSHPIDLSDIRKWAIAVYWPDVPPKLFWDEEYAQATRWNGIIAPREFNPFAWPAVRSADMMPRSAISKVGERLMNGGQKETYGEPMRPGDVICSTIALTKFEEKEGKLGLTLFRYIENRWTNQRDEFVRSRVSTYIQY